MIEVTKPIRGLPKTGQTTVYTFGDNGTHPFGWDHGQRFSELTVDGDQLVIDNATGLMWPKDWSSAAGNGGAAIASWSAALNAANILSFGGHTDWRLPNVNELMSLLDYSRANGLQAAFDAIFTNTVQSYFTSTTRPADTSTVYFLNSFNPKLGFVARTTATYNMISVRSI